MANLIAIEDMRSFPYMEIMIACAIFETWLAVRQHIALNRQPKPVAVSEEQFNRSRAYCIKKSKFTLTHDVLSKLKDIGLLHFGIMPWIWERSGEFLMSAGLEAENEIWLTLVFLTGLWICSQIIDMPFSFYSTYVVEDYNGLTKKSIWLFLWDRTKRTCLSIVVGAPIISALIVLTQESDLSFVFYVWAFMFVCSLITMKFYPILLAPIFNKFTPLREGELRDRIEKLAYSVGFQLNNIFVVDGSTTSSHSSYTYDFFNCKWFVLDNTLIQQCKYDEEILACIAHELCHWRFWHPMYAFIGSQMMLFLHFLGYAYVRNSKFVFLTLGFVTTQPFIIGLILFQNCVVALLKVVRIIPNLVSRGFEFQADDFAKNRGYDINHLRAVLIRKQEEDLPNVIADTWYSVYHNPLPLPSERLAALCQVDIKTE